MLRLIFLLLLTPVPPAQAVIVGRVIGVINGDTVAMLIKSEQTVRVHLSGINAPVNGQPYEQRARQFLASRIAGRVVEVSGESRDRCGNILGTLWVRGRDINFEMVCGGMAWAHSVRSVAQNPAYLQCERAAHEKSKGLWLDVSPIPPWLWRKQFNGNINLRAPSICGQYLWPDGDADISI